MLPALYTLSFLTHARTLLPAALASVSFGFVSVRVRVSSRKEPEITKFNGTGGIRK